MEAKTKQSETEQVNNPYYPTQRLQYISRLAKIAVLDKSFKRAGGKVGSPPNLKKFGSATTKPRADTSTVWTETRWCLYALDLAEDRLTYLFNLKSRDDCRLVSWQTVNSPTTILVWETITMSGINPLKRSATCRTPGRERSQ